MRTAAALRLYPFLIAFYPRLSHREMQAESLSLQAPVFDKSALPLLLLTSAIVTASSSGLWIQLHLSKCHLQLATTHTHTSCLESSVHYFTCKQRVPIKSLLPTAVLWCKCTAPISISPHAAFGAHCLSPKLSEKKNRCL